VDNISQFREFLGSVAKINPRIYFT